MRKVIYERDKELARRARHCGVPVVPARPWSDGLDRVDKALRET